MNKLLNTFFFGYLSLKWRRLFRTLIIIPFLYLIAFILWATLFVGGYGETFFYALFSLLLIGIPIIIGLISWLIKPFVVKEKLPF